MTDSIYRGPYTLKMFAEDLRNSLKRDMRNPKKNIFKKKYFEGPWLFVPGR